MTRSPPNVVEISGKKWFFSFHQAICIRTSTLTSLTWGQKNPNILWCIHRDGGPNNVWSWIKIISSNWLQIGGRGQTQKNWLEAFEVTCLRPNNPSNSLTFRTSLLQWPNNRWKRLKSPSSSMMMSHPSLLHHFSWSMLSWGGTCSTKGAVWSINIRLSRCYHSLLHIYTTFCLKCLSGIASLGNQTR